MTKNRFPTTCNTCGCGVPAGAGTVRKTAGRWVGTCATCARPARPAVATVWCDCGRPTCGGCDDTFDAARDRAREAWG